MKGKPVPTPVRITRASLGDRLAEARDAQLAEQTRFNAMTPEQQAAYLRVKAEKEKEVGELLQQLAGPGFVALTIKF